MIIKKVRWGAHEIEYLKSSYPDQLISMETICNHLKRSKRSIIHKSGRLKLVWRFDHITRLHRKRDPAYDRQWYYHNKERVIAKRKARIEAKKKAWLQFKSTLKCEVCDETHPGALDFHHDDHTKKEGNVYYMFFKTTNQKSIEELKKCRVLCATHHRILHWDERYDGKRLLNKEYIPIKTILQNKPKTELQFSF